MSAGPVDLLQAAAERGVHASRPVLAARWREADGGYGPLRSHTLEELVRAVEERAAALGASGVRAGRIHPLVVEPDGDGILDLLASWRLGATPAPLNARLTPSERAEAQARLAGRPGEGAQAVLWTSGTSGTPRGVALGFPALAAHVEAVSARLSLDPPTDVWVATLSPAHVGGLMIVVRALLTGSALVAPGPLDGDALARMLLDPEEDLPGPGRPPTHLSLVPTQLLRLLDAAGDAPPPPALRCLLLGGAHTPAPLLDRALAAGWPVALTWGMTEMSSQVATAPPGEVRRKPGTVGRPLEGIALRVDGGGELLVRGPTRALGYLDGTPLVDGEGWYHTGDLGRIDEDGEVWITGRRSDRIVSGGVNVDAAEVEAALRAHPSVAAACVVGIPDEEWGEVVSACVVPVEGEFDAEVVAAWLRGRLAGPKRPRRWGVVDALPLNANGKVDRGRVRERLERSGPSGGR